jgi:NAD(P)-dependent dehydrogenase (short-subunit alcohol dehydrogenase family)
LSHFISIKGKRILLVGATGVLGSVYAEALIKDGAHLVIADREQSNIIELAKELGCEGVEIDVTDEPSVCAGVQRAFDALGGLDSVVCNAAATGEGLLEAGDGFSPFESYPLKAWQHTIDVNLTGTFLVAREAGRHILEQGKGGDIITVSSIYGLVGPDHRIYEGQPFKSFPGYSASKAGVIGLTRWIATWWAKEGIRANCLVPGGVYNGHNDEFNAAYSNRTPLGRMANRDEVTGMLIYLLSDASNYCTGKEFVVDGGLSAW